MTNRRTGTRQCACTDVIYGQSQTETHLLSMSEPEPDDIGREKGQFSEIINYVSHIIIPLKNQNHINNTYQECDAHLNIKYFILKISLFDKCWMSSLVDTRYDKPVN